MRKMVCPQCKVGAFFVMNGQGERLPVYISDKGEIVPKDSTSSLEGYDLDTVYCFLPQMAECRHGMVQQHPWSGIPHDFTHPFFHFGLVAVNAALPAGGFILTERTA
mgnify:CR=1 FL=1